MVERLCVQALLPQHTQEITWCAVLWCSSAHGVGPPGSDTGDRLKNERIRTERRRESVQVSCHKDRGKV